MSKWAMNKISSCLGYILDYTVYYTVIWGLFHKPLEGSLLNNQDLRELRRNWWLVVAIPNHNGEWFGWFPKMVVPNNHGFSYLKTLILGCFGWYHHLRKHPFRANKSLPSTNYFIQPHYNVIKTISLAVEPSEDDPILIGFLCQLPKKNRTFFPYRPYRLPPDTSASKIRNKSKRPQKMLEIAVFLNKPCILAAEKD